MGSKDWSSPPPILKRTNARYVRIGARHLKEILQSTGEQKGFRVKERDRAGVRSFYRNEKKREKHAHGKPRRLFGWVKKIKRAPAIRRKTKSKYGKKAAEPRNLIKNKSEMSSTYLEKGNTSSEERPITTCRALETVPLRDPQLPEQEKCRGKKKCAFKRRFHLWGREKKRELKEKERVPHPKGGNTHWAQ